MLQRRATQNTLLRVLYVYVREPRAPACPGEPLTSSQHALTDAHIMFVCVHVYTHYLTVIASRDTCAHTSCVHTQG